MARLPDPITREIITDWDEDYQAKSKQLFSFLGSSVRNVNRKTLKKVDLEKKGDDDKNEGH